MSDFISIRRWRIIETEGGAFCFFDPSRECILIRDLTPSELDDKVSKVHGSVSASKAEAGTLPWMPLPQKEVL